MITSTTRGHYLRTPPPPPAGSRRVNPGKLNGITGLQPQFTTTPIPQRLRPDVLNLKFWENRPLTNIFCINVRLLLNSNRGILRTNSVTVTGIWVHKRKRNGAINRIGFNLINTNWTRNYDGRLLQRDHPVSNNRGTLVLDRRAPSLEGGPMLRKCRAPSIISRLLVTVLKTNLPVPYQTPHTPFTVLVAVKLSCDLPYAIFLALHPEPIL